MYLCVDDCVYADGCVLVDDCVYVSMIVSMCR